MSVSVRLQTAIRLREVADNVDERATEFEGHPAALLRAIAGDLRREAAKLEDAPR
ncbi:hypothetical protein [Breoghania sp.]|uniref:hypothetical protein n=1 Tax=Breoghania sp. TaxID=2065378 RepID=UPI0029CA123F|nr:hypothetical protein [Breoghania sp.]